MFDHQLGQLLAIDEHNAFAFNTVHEIDRVTRVIRGGDHDTFLGADHVHASDKRLNCRSTHCSLPAFGLNADNVQSQLVFVDDAVYTAIM